MSTQSWFGFGTREAYLKAKPFVVLVQSGTRCRYQSRFYVHALRFDSKEAAEQSAQNHRDIGLKILAVVFAPKSDGREGYAEDAYPHYVLEN